MSQEKDAPELRCDILRGRIDDLIDELRDDKNVQSGKQFRRKVILILYLFVDYLQEQS